MLWGWGDTCSSASSVAIIKKQCFKLIYLKLCLPPSDWKWSHASIHTLKGQISIGGFSGSVDISLHHYSADGSKSARGQIYKMHAYVKHTTVSKLVDKIIRQFKTCLRYLTKSFTIHSCIYIYICVGDIYKHLGILKSVTNVSKILKSIVQVYSTFCKYIGFMSKCRMKRMKEYAFGNWIIKCIIPIPMDEHLENMNAFICWVLSFIP